MRGVVARDGKCEKPTGVPSVAHVDPELAALVPLLPVLDLPVAISRAATAEQHAALRRAVHKA